MATKYEPVNLFGGAAPSTLDEVFVPGFEESFVLTEMIAVNVDSDMQLLTVSWRNGSNDVYLMYETPMAAKSMVNLSLYLPLTPTNPVKVQASESSAIHVTLNGLQMVELV